MFKLLVIGTDIKDISLEDLDLNKIHRQFSYKTVNLMVPKFKISQTLDLKEILSKLSHYIVEDPNIVMVFLDFFLMAN